MLARNIQQVCAHQIVHTTAYGPESPGRGPMLARNIPQVSALYCWNNCLVWDWGYLTAGWATDEKKKDWNYRLVLHNAVLEVQTVICKHFSWGHFRTLACSPALLRGATITVSGWKWPIRFVQKLTWMRMWPQAPQLHPSVRKCFSLVPLDTLAMAYTLFYAEMMV